MTATAHVRRRAPQAPPAGLRRLPRGAPAPRTAVEGRRASAGGDLLELELVDDRLVGDLAEEYRVLAARALERDLARPIDLRRFGPFPPRARKRSLRRDRLDGGAGTCASAKPASSSC